MEKTVAGYLRGDNEATDALIAYTKRYFETAINLKRCFSDDREDIIQECWIYALKMIPKWKPERGTFGTYLKLVVRKALYEWTDKADSAYDILVGDFDDVSEEKKESEVSSELDIRLSSRFRDVREIYTIRRVCVAIYLDEWDRRNLQIIREIGRATRLRQSRIKFLVDYAIVILRTWALKQNEETNLRA